MSSGCCRVRAQYQSENAMHSDRDANDGVWQQSELPRVPSGELDWDVLGKMMTDTLLGEVHKCSHADGMDAHRCEHPGPPSQNDWKFVHERSGIKIFEKKSSGLKSFLGCGVINQPLRLIAEVLHDSPSTAFAWDKYLMDGGYIRIFTESQSHKDYIGYMLLGVRRCLFRVQRDVCCFARSIFLDGKYVLAILSVDHVDCPPVPGIVRMKCLAGTGWVLEKYRGSANQTLVSYCGNVDPVGLPRSIVNTAMKDYPLCIHYLDEHMKQMQTNTNELDISDESRSTSIISRLDSTFYENCTPASSYVSDGFLDSQELNCENEDGNGEDGGEQKYLHYREAEERRHLLDTKATYGTTCSSSSSSNTESQPLLLKK